MAKVVVTSQLAELIKSIRIQNGVRSKDLAKSIDKSPAYISKLEKGEIKTLDKDSLIQVFNYITKGIESFDDIIQEVFNTLVIKYSIKDISEQLWLDNFDTVERMIPVPKELIDYFNEQIRELHITRQYLLDRINANESLDDELRNNPAYPINEWFNTDTQNPNQRNINIDMSIKYIDGLLDRSVVKSSYVFVLAVAFYLLKIKSFGETIDIQENNGMLMRTAIDLLNKYKFYSLTEKERLLQQSKTPEQYDELMNSFDRKNNEIIIDILGGYKVWSERDIENANIQFESYLENMRWDLGFMMKIVSMDFRQLSEISYTNKRKLIGEIQSLLDNYKTAFDNSDNLEVY